MTAVAAASQVRVWNIAIPDWAQSLDPFTLAAVKAALIAGKILEDKRGGNLKVEAKLGAGNVVTDADLKAEREIIQFLTSQFPDHGILAEETKADGVPDKEYVWIIDPLDGSKNYSKGLPIYSISVALLYQGRVIAAAIYAPGVNFGELFVANLNGAFCNGKPMSVSKTQVLGKALLSSGYPYGVKQNPLHCMEVEDEVIQSEAQVDNLGTSVLHLAYVANGVFDGMFHAGLRAWDVAAASLMLEKSGGTLTDWHGQQVKLLTLDVLDILATNGPLHPQLLDVISRANS